MERDFGAGRALILAAALLGAGVFAARPAEAQAPKSWGEVGDSLGRAGDAFVRDAGRVGRAAREMVTGSPQGAVGEPTEDATPIDEGLSRDGSPFNSDRTVEERNAAGLAARRLGPDATVASIEGVRRPEEEPGVLELRLRLTNNEVWDARLEPSAQGELQVERLQRIE
ncbi:MAG: hypothetical protein AAFW46_12235 [Pseudomonadota bacterium]